MHAMPSEWAAFLAQQASPALFPANNGDAINITAAAKMEAILIMQTETRLPLVRSIRSAYSEDRHLACLGRQAPCLPKIHGRFVRCPGGTWKLAGGANHRLFLRHQPR